jgi:uncharacterized OsmC-like protein
MNAEQLKAIQAPLKARYKEDPGSALVTLRAAGHVVQETVSFVLDTGKPGVPVGLHPAAGGDGTAACSGDMLLEALVGCAGVTLAAVATAMGIELTTARIAAEGELDFRGTLGVARDAPVGFSQIRLLFTIETKTAPDKVQKLVELSERYCVILQTLAHPPKVEVRVSTATASA